MTAAHMENEAKETETRSKSERPPAPAERSPADWNRPDVIVTEDDGEY